MLCAIVVDDPLDAVFQDELVEVDEQADLETENPQMEATRATLRALCVSNPRWPKSVL